VIIPAYNEAASVGRVVRGVHAVCPEARVVVVNDGSTDGTAREAARAGAALIDLPFNCGYGVALQTGLLHAQRSRADFVVALDADGQHEPAEIPKLVEPLRAGAADLVLGSRYLPGSLCYRVPRARRLVSWLFSLVVSLIMRRTIRDTTTGFQGLNARALQVYLSMKDFPETSPDADLLLYAYRRQCRVLEVPVTMHADQTGDSMHGYAKSFFYVPKMLISLFGVLLAERR